MGIEFGRQLRAERLGRGLTQAQLAEELSDPDCISLLESGRQEPTAELIQMLAFRLGIAPALLALWAEGTPHETEYVFSSLSAQQAKDVHEFGRAAAHAAAAADLASKAKDERAWWNLSCVEAECLMKRGNLTQSLHIVQRLLAYAEASGRQELAVGAHQLYAEACHRHGDLRRAVQHASEAAERAATLGTPVPVRSRAVCTLINALADTGLVEPAWNHCIALEELVSVGTARAADDTPLKIAAGEAEWVVGNVAFMRREYEEGLRHHHRAATLLPEKDVDLWARLSRSDARARLEGGILETDTLRTIERAELALGITGGMRNEQLETRLFRARWLYLNGRIEEAGRLLKEIHAERNVLACHVAGEACLIFGRCLKALGFWEEALDALQEAREQFDYAGVPGKCREALNEILETRLEGAADPARRAATTRRDELDSNGDEPVSDARNDRAQRRAPVL